MVSKQTIKDYNFKGMPEYFNYITDSIINGQRQQARTLINKLSKEQKKEALLYYELMEDSNDKETVSMIIESF